MPKNKKLALDSEIQTNEILTNDYEICIPRLSSILLAVKQDGRKSIIYHLFPVQGISSQTDISNLTLLRI